MIGRLNHCYLGNGRSSLCHPLSQICEKNMIECILFLMKIRIQVDICFAFLIEWLKIELEDSKIISCWIWSSTPFVALISLKWGQRVIDFLRRIYIYIGCIKRGDKLINRTLWPVKSLLIMGSSRNTLCPNNPYYITWNLSHVYYNTLPQYVMVTTFWLNL